MKTYKDGINMNIREVACEVERWMELAQFRVQWHISISGV